MDIFIDTEFNGFFGELISLACVSANDIEFYECLTCNNPQPWVSHHVIPVLNKPPVSAAILSQRLSQYLGQFTEIRIIADWPEDLLHFCRLLMPAPGRIISMESRIEFLLDRSLDSRKSAIPHNALEDAKTIKASATTLP